MTGTGVHLFKIPNAAFCLPSSVTLQSTKESTCVWKLGWNTLSFLFYINVKSRKIELSSIFYQKRRARSFPRSEIFSEGRVDATRVLIFSSALRKFTYAISSHIRLNTLLPWSTRPSDDWPLTNLSMLHFIPPPINKIKRKKSKLWKISDYL